MTTDSLSDPFRGLIRVSCIINSIHDYQQLLTSILQITKEVMDCDAGSLMLYDESSNDLIWHVALGEKADKLKEMGRLKMGQGIAGWVAEHRESALVEDALHDSRFFRGADTKTGFQTRSVICVPLLLENKLVGVLQALNPLNKKFFNIADEVGIGEQLFEIDAHLFAAGNAGIAGERCAAIGDELIEFVGHGVPPGLKRHLARSFAHLVGER